MKDENSKLEKRKNISNVIYIRRGFVTLLAGCMLACSLAACGGNEEESSMNSSGLSSSSSFVTPSPTPVPAAKAVKITGDVVNVRKSGSTDAEILAEVAEGDKLALLIETPQNGWYQVSYQGSPAYVFADYAQVVDVTMEQYNQLKAGAVAQATPTPDPDSSGENGSSPESGGSTASASSAQPADNQDAE
ncbi:SH3 domain-containing protein [Acutalibacter intestini]|uniref:SH3 domain-containing protein n=1 Tax=Acutalibacter intestini TaxID=3093659 RepID=UPI002AC969C8|nr:SH3 domain-containing protein [Acutalibacter sp. M00204]